MGYSFDRTALHFPFAFLVGSSVCSFGREVEIFGNYRQLPATAFKINGFTLATIRQLLATTSNLLAIIRQLSHSRLGTLNLGLSAQLATVNIVVRTASKRGTKAGFGLVFFIFNFPIL